jgi:DNA-binding NarL/FixJ family response regulator
MIVSGLNGGLPVSSGERTRVLVYDGSDVLRRALSEFVSSQPDLTTCGTAASREQALRCASRLQPDVVVLGFSFPESREVALIGDLRAIGVNARILVLSLHRLHPRTALVEAAGALGYAEKDEPPDTVLAAIRSVAAGRRFGINRHRAGRRRVRSGVPRVLLPVRRSTAGMDGAAGRSSGRHAAR